MKRFAFHNLQYTILSPKKTKVKTIFHICLNKLLLGLYYRSSDTKILIFSLKQIEKLGVTI